MKKSTLIALVVICISHTCRAQDFGYTTVDVGLEYKWAQDSPNFGLQFAVNSKIHHSIIAAVGFKTAFKHIPNTHNNERGKGWGGALGYRYYPSAIPKRLFIGVRGELWSLGMYRTANEAIASTKVLIFQPNLEAGYTFVVNDIFFITTYASAGKQITVRSPGDTFLYGDAFVPSIGISMGWRF